MSTGGPSCADDRPGNSQLHHEVERSVIDLSFDRELDCTGLLCPLPVVKTKQVMDTLSAGQVLRLLATDPGSVGDVPAWTRQTGHILLSHQEHAGVHIYYLRKT